MGRQQHDHELNDADGLRHRAAPVPGRDVNLSAATLDPGYLERAATSGDSGSVERAVLGLQRRVGNAAVARARAQHASGGRSSGGRSGGATVAQRDTDDQSFMGGQTGPASFLAPQGPMSMMGGGQANQSTAAPGLMSTQGGPGSFLAPLGPQQSIMEPGGPAKAPAPKELLSKDERIELRRLTGDRIGRAFTAFAIAVEQNRAAIKAAEKDSGGFADILLEILLGRLLPGISKGIAHLAEELPAAASNVSYRIAMQAMKEEQTTKLLETGVKVGREYLKGVGSGLTGEDEMDSFLNHLQDHFNKSADRVDRNLPSLSDEALGVTYAAYDPEVAGQEQFRAAVKALVEKYEKQVKPIGTTEYKWMNRQNNYMLYWVIAPGGSKRLALIENQSLKEWIAPELQSVAIEKFKSTGAGAFYKGQVPQVEAKLIDDLSG